MLHFKIHNKSNIFSILSVYGVTISRKPSKMSRVQPAELFIWALLVLSFSFARTWPVSWVYSLDLSLLQLFSVWRPRTGLHPVRTAEQTNVQQPLYTLHRVKIHELNKHSSHYYENNTRLTKRCHAADNVVLTSVCASMSGDAGWLASTLP